MGNIAPRLALTLSCLLAGPALADYPDRPVKIVVSYQAGSTADLPVRILSDNLSRKFNQSFVIDNRPASGGAVGAEMVARAAPDGYTLLAGPTSPITLLPHLRPQKYTPADFAPIAVLGETIYVFGVLPGRGIDSLKDLIARAKAKPGTLTFVGGGGPASANVLRFEIFKKMAGVDITPVFYKGGLESMGDFMSGVVDVMHGNMVLPQARQGQVKLLCFVMEDRNPEFPDVPTLKELGYDPKVSIWGGLLAPAGTPQPVIDALARAVAEINDDPETREKLLKVGNQPLKWPVAQLREQMVKDSATYAHWVKELDVKLE